MLIGGDDISIDVITLVTCFSMVVYIRTCFRFALTAQSKGSHRGIGGGIQILFQVRDVVACSPFFTPPASVEGRKR